MDFRSTGTHFSNDLTAGVDSSHGVKLSGGSTGGVVEAVGDDANISLTVKAKGTGRVVLQGSGLTLTSTGTVGLGQTSTLVVLGTSGGNVQFAGSTSNFGGFIFFTDTAGGIPAIGSTEQSSTETVTTIPGCTTNSLVLACPTNANSTSVFLAACYASASTAGQVKNVWVKTSTAAFGGSTCTVNYVVMRFN